ncbi:MAG: hypothetical protein EOP54_13080 [Sphingobacteriales bacterium]|nr:MAG: hypothetical protein EOP54_13080 [Sphingobacteriales bacterium]
MIISTKKITLVLLLAVFALSVNAQVKVGDNPTAINKGSIFELESANKGLLFPRVSLTNTTTWGLAASSIPVAGMMVYNIKTVTQGFAGTVAYPTIVGDGTGIYYWDGTGWVAAKGTSGNGISSTVNNNNGTYTFNYTNGTSFTTANLIGATGAAGPIGATGANGAAGVNGKTVLSGTGTPAPGIGSDGDYYIDATTNTIYGPKTGGVWPAGVSLVGATGPTGATGANGAAGVNGKTVLSGTGLPAPGTGSDGDYYIDPTTNIFYGPKAGGTWPAGVSLVGATGPIGATGSNGVAGPIGPQGPIGATGANGAAGVNGKTVLSGTGLPAPGTGSDGDYYIDPTTNIIYGPKVGGTWPAGVSLVGATGPTGVQGLQGPQGLQGVQGATGATGAAGTFSGTADNGLTFFTPTNIQLGGILIKPTTLTTDATQTLAISGLQTGVNTDNIIVANPTTGVLKKVSAVMPKFFYMPSIVFNVSTTGTGLTKNLHQEYVAQFGTPQVSSTGASGSLPILAATALEYYVTYYDTALFANVSIDANGVLTYDVISTNVTGSSFMNIVFSVK